MADKIALIESAYTKLEGNLTNLHDDCLDKVRAVIYELRSLNAKGGGFYAEQITPKINELIQDLEGIKADARTTFTTNEEIIKSYKSTIENYDTLE